MAKAEQIKDLKAAIAAETDPDVKSAMEDDLAELTSKKSAGEVQTITKKDIETVDAVLTKGEGLMTGTSQEEYNLAGSKFITILPGKSGVYLAVELGVQGWDTPGHSIGLEVTVTEPGENFGKVDKLSYGVKSNAIWKGKDIYRALDKEMPSVDGQMAPGPTDLAGLAAVGFWKKEHGHKGGDPEADIVEYSKLVSILPVGSQPATLGV